MATLDTDDANIFDAEETNWRAIVYPLLALVVIVVGGFAYYFYQQSQRDALEAQAREAFLKAKSPEEFAKVADQFPGSDNASMALLRAADDSFTKRDYATAMKDYQRVAGDSATAQMLRDSAQVGLASAQEAAGQIDDALKTYLDVGSRGAQTPYAPYAYTAAARLYDGRGDTDNERKILTEATSLDADSPFVKQAKAKLEELGAAAKPTPVSTPPTVAPVVTAPAVSAPMPSTNGPAPAAK